jgi:hypothetical protein
MNSATIELWLTDATLIGLAYWLGRIHAGITLRDVYSKQLADMLAEVKNVSRKFERLDVLYHQALEQAAEAVKKLDMTKGR